MPVTSWLTYAAIGVTVRSIYIAANLIPFERASISEHLRTVQHLWSIVTNVADKPVGQCHSHPL
jgi:hypothetical protein